jgi:hypothetical protein
MPTGMVAIEVELERKADKRLRAVLGLYGRWLSERRITGLPDGAVRIELLSTVQAQARGRSE